MMRTPKDLDYYFPAEWAPHKATWLSWPHNLETWPSDKMESVLVAFSQLISIIAKGEIINININDEKSKNGALHLLEKANVDLSKINFFYHKT